MNGLHWGLDVQMGEDVCHHDDLLQLLSLAQSLKTRGYGNASLAGTYLLVRSLVLHTRGVRLLELALSPAGQTQLERAGYVSR